MVPKEQDVLESEECITISKASSHKLHFIAQSMINVLLSSIALKNCQHLYVTSGPAARLSQSDDTYRYRCDAQFLLADMSKKTLSSDPPASLIPKNRVFVTSNKI